MKLLPNQVDLLESYFLSFCRAGLQQPLFGNKLALWIRIDLSWGSTDYSSKIVQSGLHTSWILNFSQLCWRLGIIHIYESCHPLSFMRIYPSMCVSYSAKESMGPLLWFLELSPQGALIFSALPSKFCLQQISWTLISSPSTQQGHGLCLSSSSLHRDSEIVSEQKSGAITKFTMFVSLLQRISPTVVIVQCGNKFYDVLSYLFYCLMRENPISGSPQV